MLKYIIGAVIVVLMGVGGWQNYNRERSGPCSEDYVTNYLRGELVDRYLDESAFYVNLTAGLEDERVTAASRSELQASKTGSMRSLRATKSILAKSAQARASRKPV